MVIGESDQRANHREFVHRTLIVIGLAATAIVLLFLLWYLLRVLLLGFAGILLAMFLQALSTSLSRVTRLPYGWAVTVVVLVLLAIVVSGGWLVGAQLSQQVGELSKALPGSVEQIRGQLEQYPWGRWIIGHGSEAGQWLFGRGPASGVTGLASGAVALAIDVIVILFVGLYGAAQSDWYLRGFLHLVPPSKRDRAQEALGEIAYTLRWWLFGQLFSMVVVGIMTGRGLWLLGFQLPLALGLLAFTLEIVPNVGPIIAAVPAALLAWMQGPWEAFYVILLYVVIHIVEGYFLMPLVQLRAIRLPPALHILAVVSLGVLASLVGVLVAAPLLISLILFVRMLYVEDWLGDRSVAEPG